MKRVQLKSKISEEEVAQPLCIPNVFKSHARVIAPWHTRDFPGEAAGRLLVIWELEHTGVVSKDRKQEMLFWF